MRTGENAHRLSRQAEPTVILNLEIHAVFRPDRSRVLLARIKVWIDTHTDQAIIIAAAA